MPSLKVSSELQAEIDRQMDSGNAHERRSQARKLAKLLARFAETGEL